MKRFVATLAVFLSVTFTSGCISFIAGVFFLDNHSKSVKPKMSVNLAVYRTYKKSVKTKKIMYKIYKIKNGDSIYGIAKKFLILEWQLRATNGFAKDTTIHPGQMLKIPQIDWKKKAYEGKASWYGPGFHGKKMANGQVYNQNAILIAHRTLPLGMKVRITNLKNGKSLIVPILDRGPYAKINGRYTREIDLSRRVAKILGAIKPGVIPVLIEPLV